jgi:hypothetical protein
MILETLAGSSACNRLRTLKCTLHEFPDLSEQYLRMLGLLGQFIRLQVLHWHPANNKKRDSTHVRNLARQGIGEWLLRLSEPFI